MLGKGYLVLKNTSSKLYSPSIFAIIIVFLFTLIIYLLLPSQQYDKDVLIELNRINNFNYPIDPAHMLYVLIGIPFYKLWLGLGYIGDSLRAMQLVNAFFGAGAVGIFAAILHVMGIKRFTMVLVSLMVGFSYAFWTHTEDAFFIIPAAFFALVSLLCALTIHRDDGKYRLGVSILLVISLSFAVLAYQNNLLLIPALMAASWDHITTFRRWIVQWMFISLLIVVLAGGVWIYQGVYFAHRVSIKDFITWFITSHGGIVRGLWRREGINPFSTSLIAWIATILPVYEGMRLRNLARGQISSLHLPSQLALALLGFGILLIIDMFRKSWKNRNKVLPHHYWLFILLWFFLPGLTVAWFDPAEVKLWMIPMFSFWILFAIALDNRLRAKGKRYLWIVKGLSVGLAIAVFLGNFNLAVWRNSSTPSVEILQAKYAISHLQPNDLLISSSFDWTLYVEYFCVDCKVMNIISLAQGFSKDESSEVADILKNHIRGTWDRGGKVYVRSYFVEAENPYWKSWITRYTGITPDDFAGMKQEIGWNYMDETIWMISP